MMVLSKAKQPKKQRQCALFRAMHGAYLIGSVIGSTLPQPASSK
jgi:hypothetical protein